MSFLSQSQKWIRQEGEAEVLPLEFPFLMNLLRASAQTAFKIVISALEGGADNKLGV